MRLEFIRTDHERQKVRQGACRGHRSLLARFKTQQERVVDGYGSMEVEGRVGRSSLSRRVVVPVRQNPTDGGGLGDESDDFHLGSTPAGQRIDVIDFVN